MKLRRAPWEPPLPSGDEIAAARAADVRAWNRAMLNEHKRDAVLPPFDAFRGWFGSPDARATSLRAEWDDAHDVEWEVPLHVRKIQGATCNPPAVSR